ncbi:MAG TPA: hypothetical protein VGQ83_05610 [Polyangia bacterium]|jgi:uncharacterized membrane protein YkvA (DUF1232 family)
MDKELERRFLATIGRYLVSLPFDLKLLYEAMTDPELDRQAREAAVGAFVYVLSPSDILADREHKLAGFMDDAILLRAALKRIQELGGESAATFLARFSEEYASLDEDLQLFEQVLGDLYPWLVGKLDTFKKLFYKGRRAGEYLDEEEGSNFLYDEWLAFQTDYDITDTSLEGRLRRAEPMIELLRRRRAEEAKKISS